MSAHSPSRPIRVGIVANEFFEPSLGRMGGFGWLAKAAADAFNANPNAGFEPVFLTLELRGEETVVHNTPLVRRHSGKVASINAIRHADVDIMLTIDFRPLYSAIFKALPRTPAVLWVQDPRTPYDNLRIQSLRIPGNREVPQGANPIDCTIVKNSVRLSRLARRPLLFATHAHYLQEKMEGTYGVTPSDYGDLAFLPDPVDTPQRSGHKSAEPTVIFLGRTDPIKRPWLFASLAERFPKVKFRLLGQSHFDGPGAWKPTQLPDNLELCGHLDGDAKHAAMTQAWVLVNTSIHEAMPISFIEALKYEIPLLSMQDPDGVASRFGTFVGRWDGSGEEGLPYLEDGLKLLLENESLRHKRAAAGYAWAHATHGQQLFLETFQRLARQLGVKPSPHNEVIHLETATLQLEEAGARE